MRGRRSGGRRRRSGAATPSAGGYRQLAFQPCSNCCKACVLFQDSLDRADGVIGSKWTVVSGDWSIIDYYDAGYLASDSADSKIKLNFRMPTPVKHYIIGIGVQPMGNPDLVRDWQVGERIVIWVNDSAQRFEMEYVGYANRGSVTYAFALYLYDGATLKAAGIVVRSSDDFASQATYPHVCVDKESNVISAGIGSLTASGGNSDITIQATITSDVVHIGTNDAAGRIGFYSAIGSGNTAQIVTVDKHDDPDCPYARQDPCEYGFGHEWFMCRDPWAELFTVDSGTWSYSNGTLSATVAGTIWWALEHPEAETELCFATSFLTPTIAEGGDDQEYRMLLDNGAAYVKVRLRNKLGDLENGAKVSWNDTQVAIIPWAALAGITIQVTLLGGQVQVRVTSVAPEPTPYTTTYSSSSSKVGWSNVAGTCEITDFAIKRAATLAPTYYNEGLTCASIE